VYDIVFKVIFVLLAISRNRPSGWSAHFRLCWAVLCSYYSPDNSAGIVLFVSIFNLLMWCYNQMIIINLTRSEKSFIFHNLTLYIRKTSNVYCSSRLAVTRRVPLVRQVLLTIPEHMSPPRLLWDSYEYILTFLYVVLMSFCPFFFWPLYYLFFFDMGLLITHHVFSNVLTPNMPLSANL